MVLFLLFSLSPASTPSPVPSLALLHRVVSILAPRPLPLPSSHHYRWLSDITPRLSLIGAPHQLPSPVLPFSFCPSLPDGCPTPLSPPLPDPPALCGLILQSGQPSRLCQRRHGAWLLHTDPGKLPAEFTLTRSLQCLVIRLVLGPARAVCRLLPGIFLHSTPSPSS